MDNHSDLSDPLHRRQPESPGDYTAGDFLTEHVKGISQSEKESYKRVIPKTRNIFMGIAALLFARDLVIAYAQDKVTPVIFTLAITEACLFVGIGFYVHKRPYTAILIGLVVFTVFWILSLFYSSGDSTSASVVRIVLVLILALHIPDARRLEKMEKERI